MNQIIIIADIIHHYNNYTTDSGNTNLTVAISLSFTNFICWRRLHLAGNVSNEGTLEPRLKLTEQSLPTPTDMLKTHGHFRPCSL